MIKHQQKRVYSIKTTYSVKNSTRNSRKLPPPSITSIPVKTYEVEIAANQHNDEVIQQQKFQNRQNQQNNSILQRVNSLSQNGVYENNIIKKSNNNNSIINVIDNSNSESDENNNFQQIQTIDQNGKIISTNNTIIYKPQDPVPKRLVRKSEIIKGYVIFLLVALIIAVLVFSFLALNFYAANEDKNKLENDANGLGNSNKNDFGDFGDPYTLLPGGGSNSNNDKSKKNNKDLQYLDDMLDIYQALDLDPENPVGQALLKNNRILAGILNEVDSNKNLQDLKISEIKTLKTRLTDSGHNFNNRTITSKENLKQLENDLKQNLREILKMEQELKEVIISDSNLENQIQNSEFLEINENIDLFLEDHFSNRVKNLFYNNQKFRNVDLNALREGWFTLSSDDTIIGLKPNYEKIRQPSQESLSIKIAYNENNKGNLFQTRPNKPSTINTFSKSGFPKQIQFDVDKKSIKIDFNWSEDRQSVVMKISIGDFQQKITMNQTYLNRYNAYRKSVGMSSLEFDDMVEYYDNFIESQSDLLEDKMNNDDKNFEESSSLLSEQETTCQSDLLIHAWECNKPNNINEVHKCEIANRIDTTITNNHNLLDAYFDEKAIVENKCFSKGIDYSCRNNTVVPESGSNKPNLQSIRVPNPSHRVNLEKIRQIHLLQAQSTIRSIDVQTILKNSVCPMAKHYNIYKRNWAINFCDQAYTELINKSSQSSVISAAQFLMVCRAAFYPLNDEIFCAENDKLMQERKTVFNLAESMYTSHILKMTQHFSIDVNFSVKFGEVGGFLAETNSEFSSEQSQSQSTTTVETTFRLKYRKNKSNNNRFIISKRCIENNEKRNLLLSNYNAQGQKKLFNEKDLQYMGDTCQASPFESWENCYGRYVTLIFYLPASFDYVE